MKNLTNKKLMIDEQYNDNYLLVLINYVYAKVHDTSYSSD